MERFETVGKEHGRLERRVCHVSRRLGWFADRSKWKDLRCVVMVEATRTAKGVTGRPERRLYLCSKALTAQGIPLRRMTVYETPENCASYEV